MSLFPSLCNRRILLGISGGIAAYKAAELVRRLKDAGADVRVVMTQAATEFITPLTLQALSGRPVHTALLDPATEAGMGHIELARWADRILVAPASADFIARLAQGQADDLLSAVCLASHAPLSVAPAMNQGMWVHAATRDNMAVLASRGVSVWGPAEGIQACGEVGPGRMMDVPELLAQLAGSFETGVLAGLSVMITAGPTREALDPVRFLTNHSSGKMGYALAQAAVDAGARTTLVSGPVHLTPPDRLAAFVQAESAQDMLDAVMAHRSGMHLFIAAAAVADYRPRTMEVQKIKKGHSDEMVLELVKNPDIVATVAALPDRPFVVGFAAETESVEKHALHKLSAKRLDAIVANDVGMPGLGFNSDQNAVQVFWPGGQQGFPPMGKSQLAAGLVRLLSELYKNSKQSKGDSV